MSDLPGDLLNTFDAEYLFSTLEADYGDAIFQFLEPRDIGNLELAFKKKMVFVAAGGGGTPTLQVVAERMNVVEVGGDGSKTTAALVPLGQGRRGRVGWATDIRWIRLAAARRRNVGAKKRISGGHQHSLVGSEGGVWSFGGGILGHGGHRHRYMQLVPRRIEALDRVVVIQVAAGDSHSMALSSDGDVFTWGNGVGGRLGHGNREDKFVPMKVEDLGGVTDIAAGIYHSLAVVEERAVYAWGGNLRGQLGLGDRATLHVDRLVPTVVPGVSGVVAVAAGTGTYHSLALGRDGTVMACGFNAYGQLGLGDTACCYTFTVVPGLKDVVDIDCGFEHSIAVTLEGDVYTWGKGALGQGGDDDTRCLVPTKVTGGGLEGVVVVQVAAGFSHSMALTAGDHYMWGRLANGEQFRNVPERVVGVAPVTGMASGYGHSLLTTREGVLGFGSNVQGQLGLGEVQRVLTPTAIDGICDEKEGKDE